MTFGFRRASPREKADRARDQRRWKTAARLYREHLEAKPDDGPIWVQYGHCLKEEGDAASAGRAYRKALALMPDDADLYLQIGHLAKQSGDAAGARDAYRRALDLDPGLSHARMELDRLQSFTAAALVEERERDLRRRLDEVEARLERLEMAVNRL